MKYKNRISHNSTSVEWTVSSGLANPLKRHLFGLVVFYGISTLVSYLMPILFIYNDL